MVPSFLATIVSYLVEKRINMRILSLFANIGVAEARLNEVDGVEVVVANEMLQRRAKLYQQIYPHSIMICGDILDDDIYHQVINCSLDRHVDVIMATPPCQGISTAGQQIEGDERNSLTIPAIHAISDLLPRYAVLENVPGYLKTGILHNGEVRLIPEIIKEKLSTHYNISFNVINTDDYGVPQTRERAIVLLSRLDQPVWQLPDKHSQKVTMKDAIGDIPQIDPFVKDLPEDTFRKLFPLYEERRKIALSISKWNVPPVHIYRQVKAMQYTPTGCTAFDNDEFKPIKANGEFVKGYHNTYKRQNWDTPAYTVTMDNRKISSQNNVHPGRPIGNDEKGRMLYSDARALTLYELMKIMSLPDNWPIPANTQEAFLRRIIGEGIPPLFVKQLFSMIR